MQKTFLLAAFLMGFHYLAVSQITVLGTLRNYDSDELIFRPPFNGKSFPFYEKTVPVNPNGSFRIELADTIPGFLSIYSSGELLRLFVEPSETSIFSANAFDFSDSLVFSGDNAAENQFLHTLNREIDFTGFGNTLTEIELKYDTLPEIIYYNVLTYMDEELKKLHDASAANGFSPTFVKAAEKDIHYYYVSLFHGVCISEYFPWSRGKPSRFNESWGDYWGKMLHLRDISDINAAVSQWYYHFIWRYISTYRGSYLGEKSPNLDWEKGEHIVEISALMRKYFEEPALEYALAAYLRDEAEQQHYQPLLLEEFSRFKSRYPHSEYLPLLEAALQPVAEYWEKIKRPIPEGIYFVETSDSINTLHDLYHQFEGKYIYVDVWATWCGPCKREFGYLKGLEDFLQGKNVVKLYITIDDPEHDEKWRQMVNYYDLKGYHVRVNERLKKEVFSYFGKDEYISIPRFAIIGKDGMTLVQDAKRPSFEKELYEQIEEYLKE